MRHLPILLSVSFSAVIVLAASAIWFLNSPGTALAHACPGPPGTDTINAEWVNHGSGTKHFTMFVGDSETVVAHTCLGLTDIVQRVDYNADARGFVSGSGFRFITGEPDAPGLPAHVARNTKLAFSGEPVSERATAEADYRCRIPGTYTITAALRVLGGGGVGDPLATDSVTVKCKAPPCPRTPQHNKCERSSSQATHTIVITSPPIGPVTCGPGDLEGPTKISRTADGDTIDTEIVQMELTGVCGGIPLTMIESPTRDSAGTITEVAPVINGTLDFPADSFFDVFVEIDTPIGTLHNAVPAEMKCQINSLPPYGCEYQIQNAPVPLLNEADQVVGSLTEATHTLTGPVGGTVELLLGGSDSASSEGDGAGGWFSYATVAAAAGALVLLVTGRWYTRRRWLR